MQMTIFDFLDLKESIIDSLRSYEIDEIYRTHFRNKSCTLHDIRNELSKNKKYYDYLDQLAQQLKKYITESENSYNDSLSKIEENTFTKKDDCIIIYFQKKEVGPIYCAEMLNKSIFEEMKEGTKNGIMGKIAR